jgi:hypothetical protein
MPNGFYFRFRYYLKRFYFLILPKLATAIQNQSNPKIKSRLSVQYGMDKLESRKYLNYFSYFDMKSKSPPFGGFAVALFFLFFCFCFTVFIPLSFSLFSRLQ